MLGSSAAHHCLRSDDQEVGQRNGVTPFRVNLLDSADLSASGQTGIVGLIQLDAAVRSAGDRTIRVHAIVKEVVACEAEQAASKVALRKLLIASEGIVLIHDLIDDCLVLLLVQFLSSLDDLLVIRASKQLGRPDDLRVLLNHG